MSGHTYTHTHVHTYTHTYTHTHTMFNVHSSCPQFWGLHTEERKQCYEYIIYDNYSVGLDKNTNDFMQ